LTGIEGNYAKDKNGGIHTLGYMYSAAYCNSKVCTIDPSKVKVVAAGATTENESSVVKFFKNPIAIACIAAAVIILIVGIILICCCCGKSDDSNTTTVRPLPADSVEFVEVKDDAVVKIASPGPSNVPNQGTFDGATDPNRGEQLEDI
jgi:hypothetical protein